jgi:hypothetical protein
MPGLARYSIRNDEKLIMALNKNNCNLQRFSTPRERAPDTHWIGGWMGLRTGPDVVEKINILLLPEIQPRLASP